MSRGRAAAGVWRLVVVALLVVAQAGPSLAVALRAACVRCTEEISCPHCRDGHASHAHAGRGPAVPAHAGRAHAAHGHAGHARGEVRRSPEPGDHCARKTRRTKEAAPVWRPLACGSTVAAVSFSRDGVPFVAALRVERVVTVAPVSPGLPLSPLARLAPPEDPPPEPALVS